MRTIKSLLMIVLLSAIVFSCKKDEKTPPPDPIVNSTTDSLRKLSEGYALGSAVKVEIWAKENYFTGYNKLLIVLLDSVSGQKITSNATITLYPEMDMGTMKHPSPFENPTYSALDNYYHCAVVFTMASGTSGSWTLNVNVNYNSKAGKAVVPVTVIDPPVSKLKSFVSLADGAKIFVSYIQPEKPAGGLNDFEIAIYRKSSMSFPADSSFSVTLTPEMITMGHGSNGNINPVHSTAGHYKGKVNFTMEGQWRLHLVFKSNTTVADSLTYFDVEVPK